jgi:hypothetical protein
MTDLYLSFPDEAAAKAVLYRIEGAVEADPENGVEAQEGTEVANYRNIDTIGVIYKPTGEIVTSDGGEDVPEMAPIEGWHVNVRLADGEDADALEPYEVKPKTPVRVWG